MTKVNKFYRESFTNSIKQTINPGDEVVFITSSWHVNSRKGIFEGVFKDPNGNITGTRVSYRYFYNEKEFSDTGYITEWKNDYYYDEKARKYMYNQIDTGRRYNLVSKEKKFYAALQNNLVFAIK